MSKNKRGNISSAVKAVKNAFVKKTSQDEAVVSVELEPIADVEEAQVFETMAINDSPATTDSDFTTQEEPEPTGDDPFAEDSNVEYPDVALNSTPEAAASEPENVDTLWMLYAKQVLKYNGNNEQEAWTLLCVNYPGLVAFRDFSPDIALLNPEQLHNIKALVQAQTR